MAKRLIHHMGFLTKFPGDPGATETRHEWRFRQQDPHKFKRFRIKQVEPGVKFILGFKN